MKTELSLFSTFTVIQLYKLCVVSNTKIIWVEFRFYSPTICQVLEKRNMEHDLSAFISLFLQISQYIISKYNNISAPDSWTRPGNSSIHGNWNFVLFVSYSFFSFRVMFRLIFLIIFAQNGNAIFPKIHYELKVV